MSQKKIFSVMLDDKTLNRQLTLAIRRNPQKTSEKVTAIVLDLAAESAKRAPIESGDLRNNCHASVNGVTVFQEQSTILVSTKPALEVSGEVGYSLPYALRQHEDLSLDHSRTDGRRRPDGTTVNMVAGGEAKFLERPFEERKERYANQLRSIPGEVIDEATGKRRTSKLTEGKKK